MHRERLTLVACPKAFAGHNGVIQENALGAWRRLEVDVVLVGDDPGVAAAAACAGVAHVPHVRRNALGTPLVSSILSAGASRASSDLLGYVNADILLYEDFVAAVELVRSQLRAFLVVGQRTNLDVTRRLASDAELVAAREDARARGELHPPVGIDYFVFRPSTVGAIPNFAVGRPHWDRWFLWNARHRGLPLVDATERVLAVHQNHDYAHLGGDVQRSYRGPEATENLRQQGSWGHGRDIRDATHRLTERGVVPRRRRERVHRVVERVVERFVLARLPGPAARAVVWAMDDVKHRLG